MDKTGIIVISICIALFGFWVVEQTKYQHQLAQYNATNQVAVAAARLALTNSVTTNNGVITSTTVMAATPPAVIFDTNLPEQTIVLTNGHARYTFTSRGGGLKSVELLKYPETISERWKGQIHNNDRFAALNNHAPLPVLAVTGDPSLIGDGNFTLTSTGDGVHAEKSLPDGLVITKDFQLSSNYLINASVSLKNTSDKVYGLAPQNIIAGTATPMDADDNNFAMYGGAMWSDGTNNINSNLTYFNTNSSVLGIIPRTPVTELQTGAGHVAWAAVHNQFFALLMMPKDVPQEMTAHTVTLPRFQDTGIALNQPAPLGIQTALVYPAQTLSAGSTLEHSMTIYAGPKELRVLAAVGEQFGNHAEQVMNFGTGYTSFWGIGTFFAKLLLSAMNALHDLTGLGYGWTIVLITILIKAMFWPLTAKATRSMKRMQALAPEMAALKEKYKDDVQKLTSKQWELYKKHNVSPMSGCLPMLIQMPVFIGFYTMIRSAIELRGASFLWAVDLSKPDTLFMIPGVTFLPFISTPEGLPFNLLPLLMGGAMLWQSHLQPASPGMDPAQQKMMRWLPAIFILFLYNFSSGLALYWTVNNLLTILQTKLTKNLKDPLAVTPALTPAPKSKK